jgi:hypothetical protein
MVVACKGGVMKGLHEIDVARIEYVKQIKTKDELLSYA